MENIFLDVPCRVCLKGPEKEKLILPCRCRGWHAFAHATCMRKWLRFNGRYTCKLCNTYIQLLNHMDKWYIGMTQVGYTNRVLNLLIYWWIPMAMLTLTVGVFCARCFSIDRTTIMFSVELLIATLFFTTFRTGMAGNLISTPEKIFLVILLVLARIVTIRATDQIYGSLYFGTEELLAGLLKWEEERKNSLLANVTDNVI